MSDELKINKDEGARAARRLWTLEATADAWVCMTREKDKPAPKAQQTSMSANLSSRPPTTNSVNKNRLVVISFSAGFLYNNNLYLKEKKSMKTFIIVFEWKDEENHKTRERTFERI